MGTIGIGDENGNVGRGDRGTDRTVVLVSDRESVMWLYEPEKRVSTES